MCAVHPGLSSARTLCVNRTCQRIGEEEEEQRWLGFFVRIYDGCWGFLSGGYLLGLKKIVGGV